MRLDSLTLENYRCFKRLEVEFHPELTVLIAPNGAGKTTVLDAARVALWPFVKGFDLGSQTGKSATIAPADVRRQPMPDGNMEPQLPSVVEAVGSWAGENPAKTWRQWRERVKAGTNTLGDAATKALTAYGKGNEHIARQVGDDVTLPLIAHLGTSRLWYEGRFTSVAEDVALNMTSYSRTSGYLNCLSYSSSFKTFTAWYGWVFKSYREQQVAAFEKGVDLSDTGRRFEATVRAVKRAIDSLISAQTGWHGLEYRHSEHQQLVMQHDRLGVMPVDMLSDGVRNAIAMVADLAFRACKLNPQFGEDAPRETHGVALIDEVDMFLHPTWQQTILASLRTAFPKVQFIVTTHSPQVLTTVPRENIRVLEQEDGFAEARMPLFSPLAHESGDALAKVMGTLKEPPLPLQDDIRAYEQLVRSGSEDSDIARALKRQLEAVGYQFHESDLVTWRFLAGRQRAKDSNRG